MGDFLVASVVAAFTIGSPAVPVSVAYSLQSADHQKLRRMMTIAAPAFDATSRCSIEATAVVKSIVTVSGRASAAQGRDA